MTCALHTRCRPAVMHDGTETCSWSEQWRAYCEAVYVCNMPTVLERRRYLLRIDDKRGPEAGAQLRALVQAIWNHRAQPAVANTGSG